MMVLISYDVSTVSAAGKTRLRKVAKECQNHAQRVQNSVFEGEISEVRLKELLSSAKKFIDESEDSIIVFKGPNHSSLEKEIVGKERCSIDNSL